MYHFPTYRDGKEGQQTIGDEEKDKKEKYQFNSKTMKLHEDLCVQVKLGTEIPYFKL